MLVKIAKFLLTSFLFFFIAIFVTSTLGYRVNTTDSFPKGIYKTNFKKTNLKKGDLVLFCPKMSKEMLAMAKKMNITSYGVCDGDIAPFIKKIAATKGDNIFFDKFVYINNIKFPNSNIYNLEDIYFKHNKNINSVKKSFKLKDDEYLMMSDYNKNSFDGRYIKLTHKRDFIGKIRPIYTFD